ncbi:LacI family DNA-binding transcriptional regulator [Escherichia coli]|uniref:LacI family DNA-binding transcriptional regulator n=1 Tax=Escherichia coli TaxID=562 RepID=UPI003EE24BEA
MAKSDTGRKRVTLTDVARAAGVSKSTVSLDRGQCPRRGVPARYQAPVFAGHYAGRYWTSR